MSFWHLDFLADLFVVALVLLTVHAGYRLVPALARSGIPASIVAGVLALLLGPGGAAILPFSPRGLEPAVYHGLALVFVVFGLQPAAAIASGGSGARGLAFALPAIAVLQGIVGMVAVVVWAALEGAPVHPGFGLVLPLGFQQGPGQALSFGGAWEATGMADGAQVGLIMAALGFAYCCAIGIPLAAFGRRRGWVTQHSLDTASDQRAQARGPRLGSATELLVATALCYGVTYAVLRLGQAAVGDRPEALATLYGLHFVIAGAVALAVRPLARALGREGSLRGRHADALGIVLVDLTTAGSLAAIEVVVLQRYLVPLLVIAACGGLVTLYLCMWLGRRAFPDQPFEHALLLYGQCTGTLPTGLALLRIVDPGLHSTVPRNVVLATTGALVLGLPLLLVVMPMSVRGWPEAYPARSWLVLGALVIYAVVLALSWARFAPLRRLRPWWSPWPSDPPRDL